MERTVNSHDDVDSATGKSTEKTTMQLVQQRFKPDETVHLIFEAYQIKEQEHVEGLLTLVSSSTGGTYALISFTFLRTPLTSSNDLKISNVFPINNNFKLTNDCMGSITPQQFDLSTDDDRATKYYYHPLKTDVASADYETFLAKVYSCQREMLDFGASADTPLHFKWIDDYREIGELKQELKKRESLYIVYEDIKIYCGTWNVNARPCWDNNRTLRPWLACGEHPPDIYAIGLQELDATAKVMLNMQVCAAQWIRKMLDSLHKDEGLEYEELESVRLAGIMLTVIIRKELRHRILRCCKSSVARGVFNTLGNKGGVGVSLQLNEGNICFVNSHLAAHMEHVAERNDDYKNIEESMRFEQFRTISDHDHIFWLGDLNYRINEEPPGQLRPSPMSSLEKIEFQLQYDQLRNEMSHHRCFNGYTEGPIKFLPTYKYDVGTDTFDTSEKARAPAYCDRILWKGKRIEQLAYNNVMEIRQSDHKPVYAIFNVKIKTRDHVKYKRVQEEVLKAVDKRENDNQPQITIESTIIDFGQVRFNEPAIFHFNIYNDCARQVDFEFKVKEGPLNDICEKWVTVEPRSDSLMIDSARSIRLRLMVDANSITDFLRKISEAKGKCDIDILILHVKSGRDIFITLTGEFQPSCFGLSMMTLCRTVSPISEYKQDALKALINDVSSHCVVSMPREFFLLIDYLHKQDNKVKGIFQSYDRGHQLSSQFNAVRDWLDNWSDDEFPGTPQTAAEALLLLLDLTEQPLLEPIGKHLLENAHDPMQLVNHLAPQCRNVLMHLCMFLRQGIECGHYELANVASIFGRILLRNKEMSSRPTYANRCAVVMRRLIYNESSPGKPQLDVD